MKLAIIGGGPIGLSAALMLAKRGFEVDLYEKGIWPRDKTCGQGIMPSGQSIFKSLGINFEEETSFHFQGITYIDKSIKLSGDFEESGVALERKTLSQKLYQKCMNTDSIKLFPNSKLLGLFQNNKKVTLDLDIDEKIFHLHYDYVFACDGLSSLTRKLCGNELLRRGSARMGAREHFDIVPWSDHIEVYWGNEIEAYVTPVGRNKVEVAFLWYERSRNKNQNIESYLWSNFPELRKKCVKSLSCSDFRGTPPFSKYSRDIKIERVFFLGDAYKFLDGITGEGISLGLRGANIIINSFNDWSLISEFKIKAIYLHYSLMVYVALFFSRKQKIRKLVFSILNFIPRSFDFILRLNDIT